jgi:siroheme synthase
MSLENASRICHLLEAHGIVASTPEALVEKGITTLQRGFVGDMGSQPVIILDRQLRAPTLIRVGGVVALLDGLNWYRPGDEIRLD